MKTRKSSENTEVTPSKKQLKQARLPFKLISESPTAPVTPQTRKRKLSATEAESATKVGKICKENDVVQDTVIISDDEGSKSKETTNEPKQLNPFVKLVDNAWKKKMQRSKKKKSEKKRSSQTKNSVGPGEDNITDNKEEVECMDVDLVPDSDENNICNGNTETVVVAEKPVTESMSSNPATPKNNKSLSATNSLDDSLNESTVSASNLTPKQLQKRLEAAKKREEREKEKVEREKKKQQEKDEKAKQKLEYELKKKKEREEKEEVKRKEKEEKEEQRRKEKEEKDRQKELEKKQREEKEEQKRKEKEEKEEQRRKEKEAKEEEKRKKQEALELEKQEQEIKKKKAAEAFANFFVPKQKSEKDQSTLEPVSKSSVLSSFAIKSDMRLAPTVRADLTEEKREKLESLMEEQNAKEKLYIKSLKEGSCKPLSSGRTWPMSEKDDDVMIVEDELPPLDGGGEIITCDPTIREKLRPKLLSFHDNRRPPYWGTWRKKSASIKPRNPFGRDKKQLDYEVDSDEEWEEEQEGESIDGSAAGSDDEPDADEYEVDNDVFVPHGYLSDEEATMDDDDVLSLSPETQKARLKHLEDEFESEMKKPTEKLKPRLYGILWETEDGGKPDNCVDALWNYFKKMSMIMNDPTPLLQPSKEPEDAEKKKVKKKRVIKEGDKQSPKSERKKKSKPANEETKPKSEPKKITPDVKKNQPGINSFLTKLKTNV